MLKKNRDCSRYIHRYYYVAFWVRTAQKEQLAYNIYILAINEKFRQNWHNFDVTKKWQRWICQEKIGPCEWSFNCDPVQRGEEERPGLGQRRPYGVKSPNKSLQHNKKSNNVKRCCFGFFVSSCWIRAQLWYLLQVVPRVVQTMGSVHPPAYTAHLLTLHQHRANNQYRMAIQVYPTLRQHLNSLLSKY